MVRERRNRECNKIILFTVCLLIQDNSRKLDIIAINSLKLSVKHRNGLIIQMLL